MPTKQQVNHPAASANMPNTAAVRLLHSESATWQDQPLQKMRRRHDDAQHVAAVTLRTDERHAQVEARSAALAASRGRLQRRRGAPQHKLVYLNPAALFQCRGATAAPQKAAQNAAKSCQNKWRQPAAYGQVNTVRLLAAWAV